MSYSNTLRISLMACALTLAFSGCRDKQSSVGNGAEHASNTNQTDVTGQKPAPLAVVGAAKNNLLKAEPINLQSCEPSVVEISWDITALAPDVADVEVYAGDALFASGGATGTAPTGPWVIPGGRFIMKSKGSGDVLDELLVGGPDCSKN